MNDNGRVSREVSRCVEWSIDEYGAGGGFASTTIVIERCTSDAGSSRRSSSKKSSSTIRRQKRRKRLQLQQQQQLWLTCAEDDFFQPPVLIQSTTTTKTTASSSSTCSSYVGKVRSAVKSPFVAGSVGAPYNKKLRKKNMQQQQQQQQTSATFQSPSTYQLHQSTNQLTNQSTNQHLSFGATARATGMETETSSSFFISPTHRAVAEETTPWDTAVETGSVRYQFFGQGGLPGSAVSSTQCKPHINNSNNNNNNNNNVNMNMNNNVNNNNHDRPLSVKTLGDNLAMVGGGSRVLAPLRSPSLLPPVQLLPASKADVSIDVLERCLLETRLDDDDNFSLL